MQVGNSDTIKSCGVSAVGVDTAVKGKKHPVTLQDAVYAPDMMQNLIPLSRVGRRHVRVTDENHREVLGA